MGTHNTAGTLTMLMDQGDGGCRLLVLRHICPLEHLHRRSPNKRRQGRRQERMGSAGRRSLAIGPPSHTGAPNAAGPNSIQALNYKYKKCMKNITNS
jgi:hypothetical protein